MNYAGSGVREWACLASDARKLPVIPSDLRRLVERGVRNCSYRRRLPARFGLRKIWVSPDARLRFLKPGARAFDQELLLYAERFVMPGDRVLDIGANVGEFALAAAHRAGPAGVVLAVELDPFLASLLQRTAEEPSNQDVNLHPLCAAVSREPGFARFGLAARGRAANALAQLGSTQMGGMRHEVHVLTTTIDAIARNWCVPTVIKIDVEGAERMVLEGAREVLAENRPILLVEISREAREVERILRDARYILFDPATDDLGTPLRKCLFNTLAVPEERVGEIAERIRMSGNRDLVVTTRS